MYYSSLNIYNILVRKSESKGLLGRPRQNLEDGITGNLKEMRCKSVHWYKMFTQYFPKPSCSPHNHHNFEK
jgi:hypothetical protein